MTSTQLLALLVVTASGAGATLLFVRLRARDIPPELFRTNVSGRRVPAILGIAIALGGLVGTAIGSLFVWQPRLLAALALVAVPLAWVGSWDDRRGDERPRGFKGHLGALRTGQMTGGLAKLVVGGLSGLAAGLLMPAGGVVRTALLVALTANLINLFDRAPGRAGKVSLALGLPLLALGDPGWGAAAAGFLGAVAASLWMDLSEKAMWGDAGANPVGGVLGLGLALSLSPTAGWVAVGLIALLNLASERWSFSAAIERNRFLKRIDMLGRPIRSPNADRLDDPPEHSEHKQSR